MLKIMQDHGWRLQTAEKQGGVHIDKAQQCKSKAQHRLDSANEAQQRHKNALHRLLSTNEA